MIRNQGHVEGELAEFAVAAHLVSLGCRVSYTHGQYKYDLVADKDNELLRVQVKKANKDNEKPWKYRIFTDRYEEHEVDIFAGYIVDKNEVFYVVFDDVGKNEFRINTKNRSEFHEHNLEHAKLLEDYTFERAFRRHINEVREGKQTEQSSSVGEK